MSDMLFEIEMDQHLWVPCVSNLDAIFSGIPPFLDKTKKRSGDFWMKKPNYPVSVGTV